MGMARSTELARRTTGILQWDPWREIREMERRMDEIFSRWFGPSLLSTTTKGFTPACDLYETPEELVLTCYIPGVSKEDLDLRVTPSTITIKGERKPLEEGKEITWHFRSSGYGPFEVYFDLPIEIEPDSVRAVYRNGALEVHMPKAPSARQKQVEVQVENA